MNHKYLPIKTVVFVQSYVSKIKYLLKYILIKKKEFIKVISEDLVSKETTFLKLMIKLNKLSIS